MTQVNFYHLTTTPLEKALPQLLLKVIQAGHRVVLMAANDNQLKQVDQFLWTFSTNKVIPHGTWEEPYPEEQPVYLTLTEENPNKADVLVTLGGVESENINQFDRCLDMFDGHNDEEVAQARNRWKKYQDKGQELTYWKQNTKGTWEKEV